MPYSLKQAAAACGRSRSTVYDAIKSKKLTASQDEKGRFLIEPDDLNAVFPKQPENVYSEHERTPLNVEKHSLLLQTIESLKQTVAALEAERDKWHKAHEDAAATVAQQAAALANAAAASARAITQTDEMRRQLAAIEAPKSEPEPQPAPTPEPQTQQAAANKNQRWRLWKIIKGST